VDKKEGAFESVVPADMFYTAKESSEPGLGATRNEELIERLRTLYQNADCSRVNHQTRPEGMPSTSVYAHRFGSLIRAYQAVGFTPDRDYRIWRSPLLASAASGESLRRPSA